MVLSYIAMISAHLNLQGKTTQ